MPRNDRIFYACQAVVIQAPTGTTVSSTNVVRGLQSVGMSSNFSLDQVFEIGQLEIYENVEDIADVEVTLEKVIDGEQLIFSLASNTLCRTDLVAAAKSRCDVYLAIYDDATSNATGLVRNVCWNSGMYTSSVSYSYSVDGSATESVTLVGNDKFWNSDANQTGTDAATQFTLTGVQSGFDGTDTPISGVVRRVDVDLSASTLPPIVEEQRGDLAGDNNLHVQSISVSADFGQENILELGRFGPYAKFVSFPIEVSSEFEVIATSGDLKSVSGAGENLTNDPITIVDTAGTVLTLGTKNKLSSISYSGGDTGGGNATISYSFTNFNSLLVDGGGAGS
tara:strand:+ start:3692 stop:4702 length:1011 start_codon:yes stop_codon:yes gene_type:complete